MSTDEKSVAQMRSRDTDISDMTVMYLIYPIQKCFDRVFVEKRGFFR